MNFADTLARVGLYEDAPDVPCVVGYEVAGTIAEVGEGVTSLSAGDRVMAGTQFGGYAEEVVVPAADAIPLDDRLSFEQGAAIPVNYATAWAALLGYGSLREGDRVLIQAAAGGVGHRRDADRPALRRRGLGHVVAGQARRDSRARASSIRSTTRATAGGRRSRRSTSCSTRSAARRSSAAWACCVRGAG